ncbi:MAG TPA: endonuclease/exonuclease/phosphatase family protein [Jiangellaceae bacterium]
MVTVATWNVENLFLPGGPSGPSSEDVYVRKLAYLAATIGAIGADVVCLQEIGGEEPLADLAAATGGVLQHRAAGHPTTVASGSASSPGSRSSSASTGSPSRPVAYPASRTRTVGFSPRWAGGPGDRARSRSARGRFPTARRHGTPEVQDPQLPQPPVLPAGRGRGGARRRLRTDPAGGRGGGRARPAQPVDATRTRHPVVLAGDLNDEPTAVTTALLCGPEDGNPNRPDLGDPYRLYNLADRIAAERAFSRIYRDRRELIDHIMISRPLLLAGVTADAFVDDLVGITEDVDSRRDAIRPDHAPLWGRINWP